MINKDKITEIFVSVDVIFTFKNYIELTLNRLFFKNCILGFKKN